MKATNCDKCGKLCKTAADVHTIKVGTIEYDLCKSCYDRVDKWIKTKDGGPSDMFPQMFEV